MNIVGLDIGRSGVKLFDGHRHLIFPAVVGEWRKLKFDYEMDKQGFSVEFQGDKNFVGTLARDESEFPRQMLIDNKATPDALILALTALHQLNMSEIDIVTGVPVEQHDEEHKNAMIALLRGSWQITVNGQKRHFTVTRVRVSVEGGGAFWSNPQDGLIRVVDGGSKTTNYITMKDRRYVDRESGTLDFGFDTNKSTNHVQLVTSIAGDLGKKWSSNDKIYTVGGKADVLAKHLKPYFPNTEILKPKLPLYSTTLSELENPSVIANAVGYYNIGRSI